MKLCKNGHDITFANDKASNGSCKICKISWDRAYKHTLSGKQADYRYIHSAKGKYRRYKTRLEQRIVYKKAKLKELGRHFNEEKDSYRDGA